MMYNINKVVQEEISLIVILISLINIKVKEVEKKY